MDYASEALKKHYEWRGKIEVVCRTPLENRDDLSLAYTPGVAQPCLEIQKDINKSYDLTRRSNLVAVITDGTAVLGLGDIGPEAGMPVMEGKCALLKAFGDVDAVPLCIRSKKVEDIVQTVRMIAGSFGGVNLEDISAPRCFEIEKRLQEVCDIPIFHDDQHGTAVVVTAALLNALKVVGKKIDEIKLVLNGPGAAGTAIIKMLLKAGVRDIIAVDEFGILYGERPQGIQDHKKMLCGITNRNGERGNLSDAIRDADVFIGVSVPNCVTQDMVRSMKENPILFAMANPTPEIMPDLAKEAGAAVVGTGRSDFPNQINNVLAFPGIFRGALDVRASEINDEMKIAAAQAIASFITEEERNAENIIPSALNKEVSTAVAKAVAQAARDSGVARI